MKKLSIFKKAKRLIRHISFPASRNLFAPTTSKKYLKIDWKYLSFVRKMMLINKISKFIALALALMVLVSSMSYTIDFHYCQGQLKSFSLFGKAKNCHEMASKMPSCHHKKQVDEKPMACSEGDNNCCNNKTVYFESDFDEQIVNLDYLSLESLSFVVAFKHSFSDLYEVIKDVIPFAHYKPPLIQKDIPVLFESFLL